PVGRRTVGGRGSPQSVSGCISPQVLSRFRPLAGLDAAQRGETSAFRADLVGPKLSTGWYWVPARRALSWTLRLKGRSSEGNGRVSESTHSRLLEQVSHLAPRVEHAGLDGRGRHPDDL